MRLIDADALLEKTQFRFPTNNPIAEIYAECVRIHRENIEEAPTIDAVPRSEFEQLIRERDAAIKDCSLFDECFTCKHANVFSDTEPCKSCVHLEGGTSPNWEWRGVQDE